MLFCLPSLLLPPQVEYGIQRVESALPRLCMLAQGGTGAQLWIGLLVCLGARLRGSCGAVYVPALQALPVACGH